MLVAKEKVIIGSIQVSRDLEGKENYLRSLLNNKDYDKLSENFRSFLELQKTKDVLKYNILVPISDMNLATYLFCLIGQGKYYEVPNFLNVREMQDKPLNDEFNQIKDIISVCRDISIARYDKKDVDLVQSLINKYEKKYPELLDIYRAKIWVMESTANSIEDYKDIDNLCDHILSLYPFDGETMAFQAKAKMECGHKKDAMKLYNQSINNTRNGLIWQKVEEETGISRIEIEAKLIELIDD
jgi:hypothetical protein